MVPESFEVLFVWRWESCLRGVVGVFVDGGGAVEGGIGVVVLVLMVEERVLRSGGDIVAK